MVFGVVVVVAVGRRCKLSPQTKDGERSTASVLSKTTCKNGGRSGNGRYGTVSCSTLRVPATKPRSPVWVIHKGQCEGVGCKATRRQR